MNGDIKGFGNFIKYQIVDLIENVANVYNPFNQLYFLKTKVIM